MLTATWKDISPYGRSSEDRSPQTVEMALDGLRLTVTRHIHQPGTWFMNFRPFCDLSPLESVELEDAKREALEAARDCIATVRVLIDGALT